MHRRRFTARKTHRRWAGRGLHLELLEPRLTLDGATYLVNFQIDEATPVTRYLVDSGLVFGPRGGGLSYGWSTDHSDQARERSLEPDQRLDTLIHFEVGQHWEFALANGNYEVTVAVGDPANNDGVHTINVEGVNFFNAVPDTANPMTATMQVTVSDGRLTIDQGAAAEKATRINLVHIVGLPSEPNAAPASPAITEPVADGHEVHPADVHMEATGYSDPDGNTHKSTDWEIWTVGPGAHPVWQTLGIEGVEKLHTHFGDGIFINSRAGDNSLAANTDYELRARFRDDAGAVSDYAARLFHTTAAFAVFPLELKDVATTPAPSWVDIFGAAIDLPAGASIFAPGDFIIAIDTTAGQSLYPLNESPANAIDGTLAKYLNFGEVNSGFIATPSLGPSTVTSFQITTANDAVERDPTGWQLFGTNATIVSLDNSTGTAETWTLIDSGSLSLPGVLPNGGGDDFRNTLGPAVTVDNNVAYTSYKMIFTGVKNASQANSMQFAEIQFFGDEVATPPSLRLEDGTSGQLLVSLTGSELAGNLVENPAVLANHVNTRLVLESGTRPLILGHTNLTFHDELGVERTIFLPAINLAPRQRLDLWVESDGATYFGTQAQTQPDFSMLARASENVLSNPFVPLQPGYVVEEVGSGYRLPVNIAFVPNPGPDPDDPLYYVTELYGSIQVVTRDGTKHEFATGLLDYNPQGPISGTGEQGLTGITVVRDETNPEIYHLYVGMLWDNNDPPGNLTHYPKVERIDSAPGGLSMDSRTLLLNMQPERQGQSHQISNISIGPDGKLYVHNGEGFQAEKALDLDSFLGKVLRMNLDGTAPTDNPFYNAADGITARDYIYAYGLRNPFGGAWRASDGQHYEVENGPGTNDRLAKIVAGQSYGWNGSAQSMLNHAIYTWASPHAPVNITFVQPETFNGSQFPANKMDVAFVSESGPTYATGPQVLGKRIVEFVLNENGNRIGGPTTLVEYRGNGQASVVGLAAGPDGLYFTELYKDDVDNPDPFTTATLPGARIFRMRYVNPIAGDYNIDGVVDQNDDAVWRASFGSNLHLAADGNGNGIVDAADYVVWRKNLPAPAEAAATINPSQPAAVTTAKSDASQTTGSRDAAIAHWFVTQGIEALSSRLPATRPAAVSTSKEDALLLALHSGTSYGRSASSGQVVLGSDFKNEVSSSDVDELFAELHLGLLSLQ